MFSSGSSRSQRHPGGPALALQQSIEKTSFFNFLFLFIEQKIIVVIPADKQNLAKYVISSTSFYRPTSTAELEYHGIRGGSVGDTFCWCLMCVCMCTVDFSEHMHVRNSKHAP